MGALKVLAVIEIAVSVVLLAGLSYSIFHALWLLHKESEKLHKRRRHDNG